MFVRYVRARVDFIRRILQADFSMVLPPWSPLRRDDTASGHLRRLAIRSVWDVVTPLPDRMVLILFSAMWPAHSALLASRLVRRNGRPVEEMSGMSPLRQWRQCVHLAITHNYSPSTYYQFRLFEHAGPPPGFLQPGEFFMLQTMANADDNNTVLGHKVRFFEECVRAGLPTPPIVAVFGRDGERWMGPATGTLPRESLFLKWLDGEQGLGCERWIYAQDLDQWTRNGRTLEHDALLEHCRASGLGRDLIMQPVVRNHPDIARLNNSTLCTVRVMTYRDPGSPAVPIRASFKIARAGSEVDNLHAGGFACPVDLTSGELGLASGSSPRSGIHTVHPDSGAPMAGTRLPEFRAAVDLALAAHETLPVAWSVGWDVAITPDGPMLLEGNRMWGADLAQVPHGMPFDEDFLEHMLARLTRPEKGAPGEPRPSRPYRASLS